MLKDSLKSAAEKEEDARKFDQFLVKWIEMKEQRALKKEQSTKQPAKASPKECSK